MGENVGHAIIVALLTLFAISTLYPMWHVFMYSISDSKQAISGGIFLWPRGFSLEGFRALIKTPNMIRAFFNSVLRVVVGVPFNIVMTAMLAYPLSRRNLVGKSALNTLIFFTMLFGGGMIPSFLLIKDLGLYNNPLVYILPGAISAYNMFVMKNYIISLPDELEESASLDGAGPGVILFKILLPCCVPVIAALAMFYGIGHWNSWFDGVIYIDSRKYQLFQVVLRSMLTEGSIQNLNSSSLMDAATLTTESLKMTAISLTIIPVLLVYPFIQRYYIKGLMVGSVKG